MVLVYCGIWAPILKILSNYLIFTVAFVTWDKHIDKYVRWAHIIVSQWHNLTQAQGYIWHMSIQMIVFGFTLDTLDNNWVCYSFECVPDTPDQILFPVPDTPVKWYFQYQTHQTRMSNIISSTSLTSQILFPVPVSPAKYYFQYQTHQQSHQQPKQPQQQGQTQFKSGHMEVTIFIFVIINVDVEFVTKVTKNTCVKYFWARVKF